MYVVADEPQLASRATPQTDLEATTWVWLKLPQVLHDGAVQDDAGRGDARRRHPLRCRADAQRGRGPEASAVEEMPRWSLCDHGYCPDKEEAAGDEKGVEVEAELEKDEPAADASEAKAKEAPKKAAPKAPVEDDLLSSPAFLKQKINVLEKELQTLQVGGHMLHVGVEHRAKLGESDENLLRLCCSDCVRVPVAWALACTCACADGSVIASANATGAGVRAGAGVRWCADACALPNAYANASA
eukprot:3777055-Pleurochrysis_carterae.AAC.6